MTSLNEQLKILIAEKINMPESLNPLIEAAQIATCSDNPIVKLRKASKQQELDEWIYNLSLQSMENTMSLMQETTDITVEKIIKDISDMNEPQVLEYLVLEVIYEIVAANSETFQNVG